MPPEVEAVTNVWLRGVPTAKIAMTSSTSLLSPSITQVIHVCAEHKKPKKIVKHLEQIMAQHRGDRVKPRVIIFSNRIKTVRFLSKFLIQTLSPKKGVPRDDDPKYLKNPKGKAGPGSKGDRGNPGENIHTTPAPVRVVTLHGQRSQEERESAMRDFRSGKANILVATDVAARGLHIRGLPYLVNYDCPTNLETYIHRVGRTGRLASTGHAYTFLTRSLARLAPDLVGLLRDNQQAVDPNLVQLADAWREMSSKLTEEQLATLEERQHQQEEEEVEESFGTGGKGGEGGGVGGHDHNGTTSVPAAAARPSLTFVGKGRNRGRDEELMVPRGPKGVRRLDRDPRDRDEDEDDEGKYEGMIFPWEMDEAKAEMETEADVKMMEKEKEMEVEGDGASFVSAAKFGGQRKGYVYKKGADGLGYYRDVGGVGVGKSAKTSVKRKAIPGRARKAMAAKRKA